MNPNPNNRGRRHRANPRVAPAGPSDAPSGTAMDQRNLIVPVLLCGGTGTRLWPLSREAYPKQFIALHGERTLLQQTAARVSDGTRFDRIMVVANNDHRFIAAEQ